MVKSSETDHHSLPSCPSQIENPKTRKFVGTIRRKGVDYMLKRCVSARYC